MSQWMTLITGNLTPFYQQNLLPVVRRLSNEPLIYGRLAPLTNAGNLIPSTFQATGTRAANRWGERRGTVSLYKLKCLLRLLRMLLLADPGNLVWPLFRVLLMCAAGCQRLVLTKIKDRVSPAAGSQSLAHLWRFCVLARYSIYYNNVQYWCAY